MRTTVRRPLIFGLQLALLTTVASGYELETHFALTGLAFDQSVLGSVEGNPLLELGVQDPGAILARGADAGGDPRYGRPRHIVADGARLEDIPLAEGRYMRHFFDPQQGGIGLGNFSTSPDWVLEDRGQITLQSYSLRDGLAYHIRALTLPTKAEREENVVTLLEILGRSVHHLQDMSQPAHSRVDTHAPWEGDIYEAYTERWIQNHPIPSNPVYGGPVVLDSYLDTARSFWARAGAGIAEFSSHNFVSKDTNFRVASGALQPDPNHPLPVATGSSRLTLAQLGLNWALNPNATMDFVHTQIQDQYSGESFTNDRASTYSIFSPNLTPGGLPMKLSLNRFNFEKNYEILLPRAIAYSSGLINYYFRGRLQLENLSAQGGGVSLTVRNASEPFFVMEANPQLDTSDFRLFYDARDGVRRELALTGGELSAPLGLDQTLELSFVAPTDVDLTKETPYLLVFNGVVGVEPAVAALAFGSGSAGLLVTPQYPTTDGMTGPRVVQWNDNGWNPSDASGWQAGSIDWKGHNPVDVLTWEGGGSRYRPGSSSAIYMGGRVLANAPNPLLGASIRYVNGVRTINAATHSLSNLIIYSRIFADSYANDDAWSVENPMGWRRIYSAAHGAPFTGFFFNSSGTEGQYITTKSGGSGGPLDLVKVTLSGDLALAEVSPAAATVTRTTRSVKSDETQPQVTAGTCEVNPSAPDGELEFGSGACLTRAYSGVRNVDEATTYNDSYTDRTLFCVDYRGDAVVFCELLPPERFPAELRSSQATTELDYSDNYILSAECPSWRYHVSHRDQDHSATNSRRRLKIGNVSIPWSGVENTETRLLEYAGEFHDDDYTGTYSQILISNLVNSKLIYADARSDLVVYELREGSGSYEQTGSYSETMDEYPLLIKDRFTSSVKVILSSPDGDIQLYERDSTRDDERVGSRAQGALPSGFACAERPVGWDTTSAGAPQRDLEAHALIYSSMMPQASYVVDRAGRIAGSLRLSVLPPSGSSVPEDHGYRHILTNGNLPALIPGVPPPEGYGYRVKLIR